MIQINGEFTGMFEVEHVHQIFALLPARNVACKGSLVGGGKGW
jgi:hypothetical protein